MFEGNLETEMNNNYNLQVTVRDGVPITTYAINIPLNDLPNRNRNLAVTTLIKENQIFRNDAGNADNSLTVYLIKNENDENTVFESIPPLGRIYRNLFVNATGQFLEFRYRTGRGDWRRESMGTERGFTRGTEVEFTALLQFPIPVLDYDYVDSEVSSVVNHGIQEQEPETSLVEWVINETYNLIEMLPAEERNTQIDHLITILNEMRG